MLRRNMTKEEKHLWYDFLKRLPFPVKRQEIFGNYIVDFYVPKFNLIIELDGSQHGQLENLLSDEKRDEFMASRGCKVLRYQNNEIRKNFEGVCNDIGRHMGYPNESIFEFLKDK